MIYYVALPFQEVEAGGLAPGKTFGAVPADLISLGN
jgi:hypothetical protein